MADARRLLDGIDSNSTALVRLYELAARRLRLLIGDAAANGHTWSRQHREQQLGLITVILARLQKDTGKMVKAAVVGGYETGAFMVDAAVDGGTEVAFGGVHDQAVRVLVAAMENRLTGAVRSVGRETDDVFRRVALRELALTQATGEQGGAAAALRIRDELTRQGLTGFVDRRGARWQLDTYSKMVARTTTREAMTVATGNRMVERGLDLVTISDHDHEHDECDEWAGKTFSLTGATPGFKVLRELPPFHPNCKHVMFPAAAMDRPLDVRALEAKMRKIRERHAAAVR